MKDQNEEITPKDTKNKITIMNFITTELTRGYLLERDKAKFTERRQRVYTFMKTPRELEKFLVYGFFHCLDAFLFYFTFLPLRIVLAFLKILTHPCGVLIPRHDILEPAQICDLLKGTILVLSFIIMNHIDTSMMYHLVRGQAVIKLYVFYNMLDMADKLFSSFGQDILDSLFWTATEPKDRKREHIGVLPHLVIAIIYVVIHVLLILFQATVLLVAFNSHNKALLTVMMSNNFVEIKGSLFKKIDQGFLCHISCSDVKERFLYIILLAIVFIRNMNEFSWNPDHVWVIIPDAVLVFCAEILVDWVKHAFILKFNEISADVYHSFSIKLAEDMISNRQSRAFIDYSDMVSRRMGFTPIPLAVLLLRICTTSFRVSGYTGVAIIVMLYLCLLTFKVFNGILLLGKAYSIIEEKEKANSEQSDGKPEFDKRAYSLDQSSLEKFDKIHSRQSTNNRFNMGEKLSQSIPNVYNKCRENNVAKSDSLTELSSQETPLLTTVSKSKVLHEKEDPGYMCNDVSTLLNTESDSEVLDKSPTCDDTNYLQNDEKPYDTCIQTLRANEPHSSSNEVRKRQISTESTV